MFKKTAIIFILFRSDNGMKRSVTGVCEYRFHKNLIKESYSFLEKSQSEFEEKENTKSVVLDFKIIK